MVLYRLKVHAAAKEDRIEAIPPDRYEVWVRAKAEAGRANATALELLARELGLPPKRLRIVKGATSPSKIVALLGG